MKDVQSLECGDMVVRYYVHDDGQVSMELLPVACADLTVRARANLGETDDAPQVPRFLEAPLRRPEPLIHIRRTGDAYGDGHDPGRTCRYSSTTASLQFRDLHRHSEGENVHVTVELATEDGLRAEHHLLRKPGWNALYVWTEVTNETDDACSLELVTSFSLGGLSPFAADDAPGRLFAHRFRAGWSSEGRHERRAVEELALERAWAPFSLMTERFGQRGTKPVRGFAPWIGVEDAELGVMWAAHVEAPGSWQCEFGRRDDGLSISGGHADREYGHWVKRLGAHETYATPATWLTTCRGDIDDACARLLSPQGAISPAPAESNLPVMFNEFCTTWGQPSHDNLMRIADRLAGTPSAYLVIDAGWYKPKAGAWANSQGDWQPSAELFPQGLEHTCNEIRKRGLIPGLWFEFEVAGENSRLFTDTERFLTLDGRPVSAGTRRFLDFRQDGNHELLEGRVIDLIERCGIGYIKVDYNASVGLGCDGAESPGEGLRQHVEGVRRFFKRLRDRLPNLVIENCSSGGQRSEPAFGRLADMHSFSDAHTCRDIPIVAANVARLVPADQNQIWAVVMPHEDLRRIVYSLSAGFIGRMCLSGEIYDLDADQMNVVRQAMELYEASHDVVRDGVIRRFGTWSSSFRHLTGWQAVTHSSARGQLVVLHVFGDGAAPDPVPLLGHTTIQGQLTGPDGSFTVEGDSLRVEGMAPWSGAVVLLR
jgi:alpha-galactosidase